MTNKERIQRVREEAINRAADYSGCSQATLGAIQDEFGIGNKESFKAATALSGGIANRGESCGPVICALMALGLLIGRERKEDTEVFRAMTKPSVEMCSRFKDELKKQFGFQGALKSTLCWDIQEKIFGRSFNLLTEEGLQDFRNADGMSKTKGCSLSTF